MAATAVWITLIDDKGTKSLEQQLTKNVKFDILSGTKQILARVQTPTAIKIMSAFNYKPGRARHLKVENVIVCDLNMSAVDHSIQWTDHVKRDKGEGRIRREKVPKNPNQPNLAGQTQIELFTKNGKHGRFSHFSPRIYHDKKEKTKKSIHSLSSDCANLISLVLNDHGNYNLIHEFAASGSSAQVPMKPIPLFLEMVFAEIKRLLEARMDDHTSKPLPDKITTKTPNARGSNVLASVVEIFKLAKGGGRQGKNKRRSKSRRSRSRKSHPFSKSRLYSDSHESEYLEDSASDTS